MNDKYYKLLEPGDLMLEGDELHIDTDDEQGWTPLQALHWNVRLVSRCAIRREVKPVFQTELTDARAVASFRKITV